MSVATDIRDALAADATLAGLLSGGFYAEMEITRQSTPAAFDANMEVLPCLLVMPGTEISRGPFSQGVQTPTNIYLYERSGYATINPAAERVFAVLHDQQIGAGTWRVLFDSWAGGLVDGGLGCSLGVMRFVVVRLRP